MTLRDHANKIIHYSIRAAFIALVVVPFLFCLSIGPGLGTEPPDRPTEIFSSLLFVAISPAYYGLGLLHVLGISLDFVDWMVGLVLVPLVWGAVAYFIGQSFRITL